MYFVDKPCSHFVLNFRKQADESLPPNKRIVPTPTSTSSTIPMIPSITPSRKLKRPNQCNSGFSKIEKMQAVDHGSTEIS